MRNIGDPKLRIQKFNRGLPLWPEWKWLVVYSRNLGAEARQFDTGEAAWAYAQKYGARRYWRPGRLKYGKAAVSPFPAPPAGF